MAIVVDNYNATTYTLVINSADKVSGTNNEATFQVNWKDLLPSEYDRYKIIFTFQTTGGYYSDNIYGTTSFMGTTAALYTPSTTTIQLYTGTIPTVNQYVIGLGVAAYTQVTTVSGAVSPYSITLSQPLIQSIAPSTSFYFQTGTVTNTNFSSAKILMNTGSRSFSFDTASKAPSTNLGVCQRDIQTTQTKSNTLSCFYCQNPPRVIQRPEANLITISIYNTSNNKLLTDTLSAGLANDMTSWTMLIEFVPVAESRKLKHYEM